MPPADPDPEPEPSPPPPPPPRPGDFARVLLAAGGVPPRARARDQQADLAGEAIRRQVLGRLAVLDPDPADLEATLLAIIAEQPEPAGPARGVCTAILQEWTMALTNPAYWSFLVHEAIQATASSPSSSRRRRSPETDAASE